MLPRTAPSATIPIASESRLTTPAIPIASESRLTTPA